MTPGGTVGADVFVVRVLLPIDSPSHSEPKGKHVTTIGVKRDTRKHKEKHQKNGIYTNKSRMSTDNQHIAIGWLLPHGDTPLIKMQQLLSILV